MGWAHGLARWSPLILLIIPLFFSHSSSYVTEKSQRRFSYCCAQVRCDISEVACGQTPPLLAFLVLPPWLLTSSCGPSPCGNVLRGRVRGVRGGRSGCEEWVGCDDWIGIAVASQPPSQAKGSGAPYQCGSGTRRTLPARLFEVLARAAAPRTTA
ncbi:unnamed protein product [Prorocentrum cordatum]|uniref:Secreted protein n=1 Tax=Prorocentrum cordatum TaxID=2364126 RepID=A0ABN9XG75_9DINO|nr:unnamed protein product [Polarella glacialis]